MKVERFSLELTRVRLTTVYTTITHEADTFGRNRYNSFLQVRHPRCVSIVQLYLKVVKVVLDYILDILYLYNGTIETQWGCLTCKL
jgi:hypothetical protein